MKYKMSDKRLKHIISESVKRALHEMDNDYEGNDLDYETIKMEAEDAIYKMRENGEPISWRSVAENMGFRMETLNGDDMELLKDAIEDVMFEGEYDSEHVLDDTEFEEDFRNMPYVKESRNIMKQKVRLTEGDLHKIVENGEIYDIIHKITE